MNTILEDFFDLKEVLNAFQGLENNYNWLLTDLDWSYPEDHLAYFEDFRIYGGRDDCLNKYWIKGENLSKLANDNKVYFI
ncbi:hypothetical protein [Peribacillus sp. SCS-37]|uniref:hypothetical protein n=1 Tax=Paraperibacillus esterisolvens TaxID=3115296 RepID=UPI003905914D